MAILRWAVLVRTVLACGATAALLAGCAAPAPSATGSASGSASRSPSTESPTPTATPTTTTTTPTAAGPCLPAGLTFALESRPGDSGAGSFFWNLVVINTSDSTCSVAGYPTVRLLNAAGEPIGAESGREPTGVTPGDVPLAPGTSAYSLLHLTQAGAYGCPLVPVTQVAVTFPAGGAAQAVPTPNPIQGCDDQKTQLMRVTPLAPARVTF